MVHLELFSGIGGFSKGLETAGYTFDTVYYSETDKHAIANFKYNHPYAKHIGSVTCVVSQADARVFSRFSPPEHKARTAQFNRLFYAERDSLPCAEVLR